MKITVIILLAGAAFCLLAAGWLTTNTQSP